MDARLAAYLDGLPKSTQPDLDLSAGSFLPGASFFKQLRETGLAWRCGALLGSHLLATLLLFASFVFVGYGALSGRLDHGWLAAWALALAGTVPLRVACRWLEGVIAVGIGGLLKERLFAGALAIDADYLRGKGTGALLSEVLETEAIDALGADGGLHTAFALLELLLVALVLSWGAASGLEIVLLAAWVALSIALIVRNVRRRADWTRLRFGLTNQLVENMSAHRTRLAQQPPSQWHQVEDADADHYAVASEDFDRSTARIEGALARGYVLAAVAVLAPTFIQGSATVAQMAITLGAILFAGAALERLAFGSSRGAAAWIAWRAAKPMFDAGPMFDAAARPATEGVAADLAPATGKVLQARDLVFSHRGRAEAVLRGCSLAVERGDRILLQGEPGSGKSTLAALLAGLRQPAAGFILASGLDRHTLGDLAWRRRVAAAPQYHENHILSASLGFNLLLAQPYPHSPRHLEKARELCHELGLRDLLGRMPGGLDQIVGDTGWRLSHGERSRIFLARALLQDADVVLLDESLAALDPENLRQCLECVMRRARSLIVIAHP